MNYWYKQMDDKCEMNYSYFKRPESLIDPLQYFLHNFITTDIPNAKSFESWPLKIDSFETKFIYIPQNPEFLQPKKVWNTEKNIDYFVSPRIHIRYTEL
jgi:hypothetical protein